MDEKASEIYRRNLGPGSFVELVLDANTNYIGRGKFADECLDRYETPKNPSRVAGMRVSGYVVYPSIGDSAMGIVSVWNEKENAPIRERGYSIVDYGAIVELLMHRCKDAKGLIRTPICPWAIHPVASIRPAGKLD